MNKKLYPDECNHGTSAYMNTMYGKDIYNLPSLKVICIRYGKEHNKYYTADISAVSDILTHKQYDCAQLKILVRIILQQGEQDG